MAASLPVTRADDDDQAPETAETDPPPGLGFKGSAWLGKGGPAQKMPNEWEVTAALQSCAHRLGSVQDEPSAEFQASLPHQRTTSGVPV